MPEYGQLPIESQVDSINLSKAHTPWHPLIDKTLQYRVSEVVLWIAEQLSSPEHIYALLQDLPDPPLNTYRWTASTLAGGTVGIALFYEYLARCFPARNWRESAYSHIKFAVQNTQKDAFQSLGLFEGISGLNLVLFFLDQQASSYRKTRTELYLFLCETIKKYRWFDSDPNRVLVAQEYNVVSGAAGLLGYLMTDDLSQAFPSLAHSAVETLLAYLIWLGEPGQIVGKERWFISPQAFPMDFYRQHFPGGYFNCGMAHGLPGPLAALSLAHIQGYAYPGLREALVYMSDWLLGHCIYDAWGINWPGGIPLEVAHNPVALSALTGTWSAWCYGAPGVSRSLWLAGQALENAHLCQTALAAIEAVLRRPPEQRRLDSPTLCYGLAGLLLICLQFANECPGTSIEQHIPVLVSQLLDAFNPDHPFGFQDRIKQVDIDQPGWLTGTVGVALTLLAAATSVPPTWNRLLLVS